MAGTHRIGLANLGNTCFMNAVFQALRHSPEFLTHIWKRWTKHPHHAIRLPICKEIRNLYTLLLGVPSTYTTVDSRQFLVALLAYIKDGYKGVEKTPGLRYIHREQLDAEEFLNFILDSLHECMKRSVIMTLNPGSGDSLSVVKQCDAITAYIAECVGKVEENPARSPFYSPILEHFKGQDETTRACKKCGTETRSYQTWSFLNVEIPLPKGTTNYSGAKIPTLLDCVESYYKTTDSEEHDETRTCETCKERTSYIQSIRPVHFPTNLIIAIKRFTWDNRKIRGTISFDLDSFDVSPFLLHDSPYTSISPTKYRTYAIVEQGGITRGGHYIAYGRQIDAWICYDDSTTREVPTSSVITADSYVMFMTNNPDYTKFHKEIYPLYQAHAASLMSP